MESGGGGGVCESGDECTRPSAGCIRLPIDPFAEHCRAGSGEIEFQLHHGVEIANGTENARGGALANPPGGCFCGADEETQILSDRGCDGSTRGLSTVAEECYKVEDTV